MMGATADDTLLEDLQRKTFNYFIHECNPENGLIKDKSRPGAPASIAAVGLALSSYPVGVERGFITRSDASRRTLKTLRFFLNSSQGTAPDATGYKGFYYHFLDMQSGKRVWKCELSTVDTAFVLAGMLTASEYFTENREDEKEIRGIAEKLFGRVDWNWALNDGLTVAQGWSPEGGFVQYRWQGYDEAMFLYVLGLGSPTHPLPEESYTEWTKTYNWRKIYDFEFLYSGPLFTHQISHLWIDYRGIKDDYMRQKESDYFLNSRTAVQIQQQYAVENPKGFNSYGANCWGITASDGPGPCERLVDGRQVTFYDYDARGVPDGPDDGSIAPWAVVASLAFAPDIVMPTLHYFEALKLRENLPYGFKATFNPTYLEPSDPSLYWISPYHFGLNQGPIVLMIENYRSELLWNLMRGSRHILTGLRRAGFSGGWIG